MVRIDRQEGFTLLEMTMVLIVVGLIIGFGFTAWMSMKSSQQISAAKTTLRTGSECLVSYVLHSERIPPQTYFSGNCSIADPWGNSLLYENSGDNVSVDAIIAKTFRDNSGDFPDAAWLVVSKGPDGVRNYSSTPTLWDCSNGDDLCQIMTKNNLLYEIAQ